MYSHSILQYLPVTIANGASLSSLADLSGYCLAGILMPAAWTAANLTLQASYDKDATLANVYNSGGTEITLTAAPSVFIIVNPWDYSGIAALKLRSGTSGAAVAQGAARTIYLALRPVC